MFGASPERVASQKRKRLMGYCWEWLEQGSCSGFCTFKHEYPPHWTAAQREKHTRLEESVTVMEQEALEAEYIHQQT